MVVKGWPKPVVKWSIENQPLVEGKRIQTKVKDDSYTLFIDEVQFADEGEYRCTASNEYGQVECACELLVNEVPEFLKRPNDLTIEEGSDAIFEVEVNGHPEPEVLWLKDDVLQRPGDRIEMIKEENVHTLG